MGFNKKKALDVFLDILLILFTLFIVFVVGLDILSNLKTEISLNYNYNVSEPITVISEPSYINFLIMIGVAILGLAVVYLSSQIKEVFNGFKGKGRGNKRQVKREI